MSVEAISDNVLLAPAIEQSISLSKGQNDRAADQEIQDCLSATAFTNKVILYSYDMRSWPIRVIYNPELKLCSVDGTNKMVRVLYALVSKDTLPQELEDHLKALVKEKLESDLGGRVENATSTTIRDSTKLDFDWFENLQKAERFPGLTLPPITQKDWPELEKIIARIPTPSKQTPEIESPITLFKQVAELKTLLERISSPSDAQFNPAADQKIREIFQSKVFVNEAIEYSFNGITHQLRIVSNPQKEPLHGVGFPTLQRWSFALISSQPITDNGLRDHLQKLAPPEWRQNFNDYEIYLNTYKPVGYEHYENLRPVSVNIDGQLDAQFDAEIKNIFASKQFVNKVLYYQINGKDHIVRLIHNPEKLKLTASGKLKSRMSDEISLTRTWSSRYGIIVNNEAPKSLIDRIVKLANPSYWNWYLSFVVNNEGKMMVGYWVYDTTYCDFYSGLKK